MRRQVRWAGESGDVFNAAVFDVKRYILKILYQILRFTWRDNESSPCIILTRNLGPDLNI